MCHSRLVRRRQFLRSRLERRREERVRTLSLHPTGKKVEQSTHSTPYINNVLLFRILPIHRNPRFLRNTLSFYTSWTKHRIGRRPLRLVRLNSSDCHFQVAVLSKCGIDVWCEIDNVTGMESIIPMKIILIINISSTGCLTSQTYRTVISKVYCQ